MKKYGVVLTLWIALGACNNEQETTESSPNLTNIQNVNGNMPDTSGSIPLDNRNTTDSVSTRDTIKR